MSGVLIAGGAGRLGRALARTLSARGVVVLALSREEADAASVEALLAAGDRLPGGRPDAVVCAAAWTDVAGAERHRREARAGNVLAPRGAARAAARWGAPILHFSTDYVFSGGGRRGLSSSDRTLPQGAYGRTKLAGERAVRDAVRGTACGALIVRAGWLFSETEPQGFPARVLELALSGRLRSMRVNQYGRPTSYESLAAWCAEMIAGGGLRALEPGRTKTLHFAPEGPFVSRRALALHTLRRAASSPLMRDRPERARLVRAAGALAGVRAHVDSQPENCRLISEQQGFFWTKSDFFWPKSVDNSVDNFLRSRFAIGTTQD